MVQSFQEYVSSRSVALNKIHESLGENLEWAISEISKTFKNEGRLFICGNGGSAADAQHVAAEFVNGMSHPNNLHLPAIALSTDTSVITAHANDYSFDGVFEVQLRALAKPGDCVLLLTTSGKSRNVAHALKYCQKFGISSIVITGNSVKMSDYSMITIAIPSSNTQVIQELTLIVEHYICERVIEGLRN